MIKGDYVRIKKLLPVDSPRYPTPDSDNYTPGTFNGEVSLPVDYEVEGWVAGEVSVGSSVMLLRTKRNGVKCGGYFHTSTVESFDGNRFFTQNSIYEYEVLEND